MTCNIYSFARPIFSRYTTFNSFEFFFHDCTLSIHTKKVVRLFTVSIFNFFLSFYVSPSPYCIKFGKDFGDQLRNCNIFSLNGGSLKHFILSVYHWCSLFDLFHRFVFIILQHGSISSLNHSLLVYIIKILFHLLITTICISLRGGGSHANF